MSPGAYLMVGIAKLVSEVKNEIRKKTETNQKKRKGEKMKVAIKCFEFLTNKGNGKNCALAPLINGKYQDCAFKVNGMKESFTQDQKIKFIYALARKCREWHIRNKKVEHYYKKIHPQIDTICTNISCQEQAELTKK